MLGGDLSSPPTHSHFRDNISDIWPEIKQDYRNYYSWDNFGMLVAGFSVGAVFANTNIDQTLRNEYQDHVRSAGSDQFAHWAKEFGTGGVMLPAMAAGWLTGEVFYESPLGGAIGEWGDRSLRSAGLARRRCFSCNMRPADHAPVKPVSAVTGSHLPTATALAATRSLAD